MSHDRKSLLFRSGETWGIVDTGGDPKKTSDGSLKLGSVRIKIDPMAEWQQIFREGWRFQRDFLYVDNGHGAPWEQVYQWYQPWVANIRHRYRLTAGLEPTITETNGQFVVELPLL